MSSLALFEMPAGAEATGPPERSGGTRDGVRLLAVRPDAILDRRFHDLPELLMPGDLLVVNTSATLPAALTGRRSDGSPARVHVSTADADDWVVEIRRDDNGGPDLTMAPGDEIGLPGGIRLRLSAPFPDPTAAWPRLWRASPSQAIPPAPYLLTYGEPIAYRYLAGGFPLADYQTVYATESGSAEMPSAGRPFTARLLVRLMARGVTVAPIVLHAGVSSPELNEQPAPERFDVPADTARLVGSARAAGRRVVAVGTTAVRALETAADPDGAASARRGWTNLVLGPDRPARVVDGLITGLHTPESSHLLLLEAVAGLEMVERAYNAAVELGYRWHEFGDSMLFLT